MGLSFLSTVTPAQLPIFSLRDSHIKLTQAGEILAKRIYERHTVLTRLFINLGVDEETAAEDACRIEH